MSAHVDKIIELVAAGDPESLDSMTHLVRSLNDPELVDTLLEGATYARRKLSIATCWNDLTPEMHHHVRLAILALIATGLGARAQALRAQVTRLDFAQKLRGTQGRQVTHSPATPVDIALLEGLPLRTLRVSGLEVRGTERLVHFPQLESLTLDTIESEHMSPLTSLRTLMVGLEGDTVPTLPECEELQINSMGALRIEPQPKLLTLTAWSMDRVSLGEAPLLYRLELSQAEELATDAELPALQHLHLMGAVETPAHFSALRDLRTRTQHNVADLPALRRLEFESKADTVAGLKGMRVDMFRAHDDHLVTLAGYPNSKGSPHRSFVRLQSLRGIGAIRGIETLRLRKVTSLEGIEAIQPTLRGLDLRGCGPLRDLDRLTGFDLRVILIAESALQREMFPDDVRWAVETDPSASVAALAMRMR